MKRQVELASLRETMLFGQSLAVGLRPGDVLAFSGPIGAGKTTIVRAIADALTGNDEASSPSFTLWQHYRGRIDVNHLDLYRIEDERELPELGLFEAFTNSCVTLIEWPERAPSLIPATALRIGISGAGDDPRLLEIG
jgi:tRNA threonylcarbamoyl adenosine modification protein YjeE